MFIAVCKFKDSKTPCFRKTASAVYPASCVELKTAGVQSAVSQATLPARQRETWYKFVCNCLGFISEFISYSPLLSFLYLCWL